VLGLATSSSIVQITPAALSYLHTCFYICVLHCSMTEPQLDLLSWNVRGLNRQDRKDTIHQIVVATRCHIACLQETKLSLVDQHTAACLGGFRLRNFVYKPAGDVLGTQGRNPHPLG